MEIRERSSAFAAFDDRGFPHIVYAYEVGSVESQTIYEVAQTSLLVNKISETEFVIVGTGERLQLADSYRSRKATK